MSESKVVKIKESDKQMANLSELSGLKIRRGRLLVQPVLLSLVVVAVSLGISLPQIARAEETIGDMLKKLKKTGGASNQPIMSKQSFTVPVYNSLQEPKRERLDFESIKPTLSREELNVEKVGKDRVELEKITDRQIQELFRLTEKMKNSPNRGELWLRLAELYVEKSDYIKSRRQSEYEEKLQLYNQKKTSIKPEVDLSESAAFNKKAIQLYEYFVRDFRNHPKMDQALYFLGFNYIELGEFKKGASYYTRLATEYPRSPYVGEANFSIGEYYFDEEKWDQALDAYKKVIKNKNASTFGIALYKAAWCLHRKGKSNEGLKFLEVLIRLGADSNKKINLAKLDGEARRDLVVFYAESGDPERAFGYFAKQLGEDRALGEVEKLAYYYSDKGEREKAAILFKKLIAKNRLSPKAFDYQFQIVRNFLNDAKNQRFKEELYTLIKDYGPKSEWRKENKSNSNSAEASYKTTENFLKTYTLQQHQSAQNSRGKFSQEQAAEGYKLYLSEFQDAPSYPDMMFFYGELLYDMEKFGEAAQQYAWVAKNAPQSKYAPKAGMNMILGLEKNLPTEEQMQARVGQSTETLPLDPRVKQFIENGEWYLKSFQKADKNVELRFKIARLYYLSNHFVEAEKIFKEVIQNHPKSKQAEYAANLLLDMYNLRKDFVGLERVGQELLTQSGVAESSSAEQIKNILERASFKAGEELEAKKDYLGSAKKFDAFAKKYPRSNFILKAQFNAGVNYQRANRFWPAINAFELVLHNRDKAALPLQEKAVKILPKMYQSLGMYHKAAGAYANAGERNNNPKEALDFFYNAAILYDALNSVEKANKYYGLYLKKASHSEKAAIFYRMAELSYRNQQYYKAIDNFKEYLRIGKDPELVIEAHYKITNSYNKLRNRREWTDWRAKVVSVQKNLVPKLRGPGAHYAAQIRLQNIEQVYNHLVSLKFPANSARIKKVADEKLGLVTQLNQELAEIIKYDSAEEIVGSLELLGRTNAHMNESLLNAPLPPEVAKDDAAKQQYTAAVAEMARPFLAKAIESYKGAVSKGKELETYTQPYFNAIDSLRALDSNSKSDLGSEALAKTYQDWMGLK